MKFIVSSLKLLKSLQAMSGVIGSNNTLPILDDFLFQLSDTGLKITGLILKHMICSGTIIVLEY